MAGINKSLQLPKAVLDMKFMKKTKDRLLREKDNTEDHGKLYAEEITNEMRNAAGNYISESSFIFCEELMEGRLSFRGMNADIERLMELEAVKQEVDDGEMEKDVPDEILAKKMAAFHSKKRPVDNPNNCVAKRKK